MIFSLFRDMISIRPTSAQLETDKSRQDLKPQINDALETANEALTSLPIGAVTMWAGTGDPANAKWLVCDGRLLDSLTYPDLFDAIGQSFNTGGESTGQFRIPDSRSRTAVGAGQSSGLSNRALAARFGNETHTLVTGELAAHSHTASGGSHGHGFIGGSHQHAFTYQVPSFNDVQSGSGESGLGGTTTGNGVTAFGSAGGTVQSADATPNIGSTGSGTAHNNMQPSIAFNFIIRCL